MENNTIDNQEESHDYTKWERRREKGRLYWKKWEEVRKNKMKFAFLRGTLGWGVVTYTLIVFLNVLVFSEPFLLQRELIRLLAFMTGGFLFGLWDFRMMEKRYREYIRTKEEN